MLRTGAGKPRKQWFLCLMFPALGLSTHFPCGRLCQAMALQAKTQHSATSKLTFCRMIGAHNLYAAHSRRCSWNDGTCDRCTKMAHIKPLKSPAWKASELHERQLLSALKTTLRQMQLQG